MLVDMVCDNEKCEQEGEIVEVNVPYELIQEQTCSVCDSKLRRIYSAGMIKTGDGLK